MSHHPECHLFVRSCSTTVAKLCMKRCGAFLSGAIEASISITRGAGGFSIIPGLRCAHVVPENNPAFELVARLGIIFWDNFPAIDANEVELSLETGIQDLVRLFDDGKASPYDVDIEGNTLLHVRLMFALNNQSLISIQVVSRFPQRVVRAGGMAKTIIESIVWLLKRLAELNVPLNWTNDCNLYEPFPILSLYCEVFLTNPGPS